MKRTKKIIATLLILAIGSVSCKTEKNKKEASVEETTTKQFIVEKDSIQNSSAEKNSTVYKGLLTLGLEVSTIKMQDSGKEVWVIDPQNLLQDKYTALTENKKPYTAVYIEVKGKILPKAEDGFAEEFDNILEITELVKMTEKE